MSFVLSFDASIHGYIHALSQAETGIYRMMDDQYLTVDSRMFCSFDLFQSYFE